MDLNIRWIEKKDLNNLVSLENISSNFPWSKKDFLVFFKNHASIGYVAIKNNNIVGFALCQMRSKKIKVVNIVVHPNFRRKKIGSLLMAHLISKLGISKDKIEICVPEYDLTTHLFLKNNKFKAVEILQKEESNYYKFNYFKHQKAYV